MSNVLYPDYMLKFKCIGSECEDTCCQGWTIHVDRDTYMKYIRLEDDELTPKFRESLELKPPSERKVNQYAVLKMDPRTGACTFFQEGLCSIQLKRGESYLANVCATYPRRHNQVDDSYETSAYLSCPEAARLALLNPEGISFTYIKEDQPTVNGARLLTQMPDTVPYAKYFWDIRIFAIEILQNRRFSLPHRIMQLAVLADMLDEAVSAGKGSEVPNLIRLFREQLENGGEVARTGTFPVNPHFQVKFLNSMLLKLMEMRNWHNPAYGDCLDHYVDGIQMAGVDLTEEQLVDFYMQNRRNYCEPFMSEHHYIFENYIVNHLFHTAFPYATKPNMFDKVFFIGLLYALLRLQLIGMAAYHRGLNQDLVIKLIYSFTRNFEHHNNFRNLLQSVCEDEKVSTLGHLSLLVMEPSNG